MLKVKLKESALVNVNKNRCSSLQINTLRCKLIYTIVKVRNECQRNYLEIGLLGTGQEIIGGPAKDPFI